MLGKKREQANSWQGGKKVNRLGYSLVFLPEHHLADGAGYVYEHRLIWEQNNGRELRPGEHVHHIDGNPRNNSPDNLVALSRTAHYKTHGDSITTSRRKSEGQKRRWSRPEEHRKQSEAIRKAWADGRRS